MKSQSKYRAVFSFAICTIIIFAFMEYKNVTRYWWDADEYRYIAQTFISGGRFSFNPTRFNNRAYTWPLVYALLTGFGHFSIHVFRFLNSLMYAFLMCVIMGNLFEEIFEIKISGIKRSVPVILTVMFWPGLILYPLIDIMAVLTSMISVYMFYLMYKRDNMPGVFALAVISGFASDAALNMRATYKYCMYAGIIVLLIMSVKKRKVSFLAVSVAGYVLGAGISAAPQIYANWINYGIIGWDNPLSYWNGGNRMVYLLYEGYINPRIECYIGPGSNEWISAAITSVDPVANAIFHKYGVEMDLAEQYALTDFIRMVLRHPAESAAMYTSHAINCLDARYGIIYIESFGGVYRYLLQALTIVIYETLFIDAHIRLKGSLDSGNGVKRVVLSRWFPVACFILIPVAVSLPGHIEPRYAVAFHLLVYAYLAYKADLIKVRDWVKAHAVTALVLYICLFSVLTLVQNWSLGLSGYNEFLY